MHAPVFQRIASNRVAWLGEVATAFYIVMIALIAQSTGLSYMLFPELGALSHDVLKRPHGTWAKAPLMIVITPFMTGAVGTLVTKYLAYGLVSVLLTVGSAILIIRLLRSPIAPAISAGLLPLTLGDPSWWYPPCLLVGLVLLATISRVWHRLVPSPLVPVSISDLADDIVEEAPRDYSWLPFFFVFLTIEILLVGLTGRRFLLFPPLVVIGFEMFAHAAICPWAGRPLILPVACTLSATAGVILVGLFGAGPLAAVCSIVFGIAVLRVFNLHVPPALAVGLLPLIIPQPNYEFPVVVAAGTLLLTMLFLAWQRLTLCKATEAITPYPDTQV
ncbi:HPP family protein [Geobacter argillaceus]|uniref:HPP family n=1 Tax=Geobacter argillaceus TaxID=345631 RepID=A0A562VGP4_9BACT|nr:HPP family protein [Geobacter argillaceus]TWJ17040.1 HPP family [Geobacter argillaceus]